MAIYGNIENLDAVILGNITAEPIHIDGEDGRGVVSARINAQQHLIITYTDGTTEDAGAVGEGAGVIIDPTLSIEGAAADAKATGEALGSLAGGMITNAESIGTINSKIPSQATPQNQLADKAFVNSTVGTNTAYYISNNGQPFTSLAQLQAYSGTVTNNDYAFVVGTDSAGNTTYTRYKYNESTHAWGAEFVLNNSSFTAAQWAAIESGITAALVASYNTHIADGTIHVTAADKTAWNGKLTDAPSDGKQYARKNGAWSEVQGGGTDNPFVVNGFYDGSLFDEMSATYAQILSTYNAGKVVELHLATDEGGTELVLALTAVVDASGELIFGVVNTYEYFDDKNSYKVVCADNDTWHFSGYDIALKTDIPTKTSDLTNDSGFLTLGTLPIYNGGVE